MSRGEFGRPPARARGASALDGFDWAVLGALSGLSLVVLLVLLVRVWTEGGLVTGSDGFLVVDQLQYLGWIRQAGDYLAIENLYDLESGPRTLVHPGVALSGLLHALGLGLVASYLVWKPIAVLALFAGTFLTCRRFLTRRDDRRLALVLALFAVSPLAAFVGWSELGDPGRKYQLDLLSGEMWVGTYLWGYLFTAVAVGLMPLSLLAYERGASSAQGGGRLLALAAAAALVCSWFQPWQGATLALVFVGAELVLVGRKQRRPLAAARRLAGPLAAIAAPLVYFYILSRTDPSWALADRANDVVRWPWWITVVGLAPFALPAAFAYRLPAPDFGSLALRLWPPAALAVFYLPFGTFPFHALQGLTLPLVVLALLAARDALGERPLSPAISVALVVVMVVPGTLYRADQLRGALRLAGQPFFLKPGEHDALDYLARADARGGVLAPYYTGQLVPAYTGRETWVGAISWTPNFVRRRDLAEQLFTASLDAQAAKRVVRRSGARFLLSDCHARSRLEPLVRGVARPVGRFGCATVYEVTP